MRRGPTQALYTVGELSRLSGVSAKRIENLLKSNEVEITKLNTSPNRRGQTRIVFLSALERAMPDLLDSIRLRDSDD